MRVWFSNVRQPKWCSEQYSLPGMQRSASNGLPAEGGARGGWSVWLDHGKLSRRFLQWCIMILCWGCSSVLKWRLHWGSDTAGGFIVCSEYLFTVFHVVRPGVHIRGCDADEDALGTPEGRGRGASRWPWAAVGVVMHDCYPCIQMYEKKDGMDMHGILMMIMEWYDNKNDT